MKKLLLFFTTMLAACGWKPTGTEEQWSQDSCDTKGQHFIRPVYYYSGLPGVYPRPLSNASISSLANEETSPAEHGGTESVRGGFGETGMAEHGGTGE